jgi:nucleotide-binding universal stress UspA family protein
MMYRTIMVPLDGSSLGEYALPLALGLARGAGATVDFVHVCTPVGPNVFGGELDAPVLGVSQRDQMRERASAYLIQLADSLSARWEVAITATILDGRAADSLCDHAVAAGADLVVMTTHGYGPLARAWMGSVADKLVRRLPVPILLARPHEATLDLLEAVHERVFEHVLIPLDGSTLSEEILDPALALGALMDAEYILMEAIEVPALGYAPAAQAAGLDDRMLEQWRAEAHAYLERVAARIRARGQVARTNVVIAPPAMAIIDYAREHAADLIALSTHGRGGLARMLLGSVADKVVRGADVPVLLQRPRGEIATPPTTADRTAEQIEA